MPFYQNPFPDDFHGYLLLGDRQFNITFKVPANRNTPVRMVAWADGPYNTVGNTTLTIKYSINSGLSYFDLTASITSGASVTVDTIVSDLNSSTDFSNLFTAEKKTHGTTDKLFIYAKSLPSLQRENFKCYIVNSGAETVLKFNKYAGVAELPSYFDKHIIGATNDLDSTVGRLVKLTQPTHNYIITDAGLSTTAKADYQLLEGRSGIFNFQKITVDGSDRITQIIEYPAGAVSGDLARKIDYSYTSSNKNPDQITEIPYVLTNSDLVTPP